MLLRFTLPIVWDAVVYRALPLSIFLLALFACAGFLPPWSACGVLVIGGTSAWASHVLKRDRVALSICVATTVVCGIFLWPRVAIRAPTADDETYKRYFGAPDENFVARNIAVAEGTFTLHTWLAGYLYYVEDGVGRDINAFSVGRTPNAIGAPHWVDMRITLALVRYDSENGPVTHIATAGQSRGGGSGGDISTIVEPKHRQLIAGRLLFGQSRILYVEGDSQFTLNPSMTVQSFAKDNKGKFYVVVVAIE